MKAELLEFVTKISPQLLYQVHQFSKHFIINWKEFQAIWASTMEINRASKKETLKLWQLLSSYLVFPSGCIELTGWNQLKLDREILICYCYRRKIPEIPTFLFTLDRVLPETEALSSHSQDEDPSCQHFLGKKNPKTNSWRKKKFKTELEVLNCDLNLINKWKTKQSGWSWSIFLEFFDPCQWQVWGPRPESNKCKRRLCK